MEKDKILNSGETENLEHIKNIVNRGMRKKVGKRENRSNVEISENRETEVNLGKCNRENKKFREYLVKFMQ